MNLLVVIAVWASIGASSSAAAETTMEGYDPEDYSESERIIGGSDAVVGQFPYAVALHYNGGYSCTASIISPTTVMTAAHCVVKDDTVPPADSFYLIANVNRVAKSVRIDVASVIPHPEYTKNDSKGYDIAILKTVLAIEFSDEVGAVCIAGPDTEELQYESATAIGWGSTSLKGVKDDILQHVEQKIINCSASDDNENKLCATGSSTGVCPGDSGGPLVALSADELSVEIGIASYITDECGEDPGVFTRVSSYYDFIMKEAQDDSICVV